MSAPWFHLDPLPPVGASAHLDRDEAKHAVGARRLGPGDPVMLFDGHGGIAHAVLAGERDRSGDVLARVSAAEVQERLAPRIILGAALPKGDRLATLLDMTAQLGVAQIVPLETAYGVIDPANLNRTRAQRVLLEACKQSRNAWIPEIGAGAKLAAFVAAQRAVGMPVLLAHPGGGSVQAAAAGAEVVAIAIGPEGGFSDAEVRAATAAGAVAVSLGATILRIETAAVAACAALRVR